MPEPSGEMSKSSKSRQIGDRSECREKTTNIETDSQDAAAGNVRRREKTERGDSRMSKIQRVQRRHFLAESYEFFKYPCIEKT